MLCLEVQSVASGGRPITVSVTSGGFLPDIAKSVSCISWGLGRMGRKVNNLLPTRWYILDQRQDVTEVVDHGGSTLRRTIGCSSMGRLSSRVFFFQRNTSDSALIRSGGFQLNGMWGNFQSTGQDSWSDT